MRRAAPCPTSSVRPTTAPQWSYVRATEPAASTRHERRAAARSAPFERAHARRKRALLPVEEVVAERPADRAEGELLPRNLLLAEEPHVEALRAGAEVKVDQAGAEDHVDLADLRQADHRVERADLDAGARLLERLARRARVERLVVLEEACGQRPQTLTRLDGAPAQEHLVLPLGQAADHHLRILVVDGPARRAHVARQVIALRDPERDAVRPAVAAEFHRSIIRPRRVGVHTGALLAGCRRRP